MSTPECRRSLARGLLMHAVAMFASAAFAGADIDALLNRANAALHDGKSQPPPAEEPAAKDEPGATPPRKGKTQTPRRRRGVARGKAAAPMESGLPEVSPEAPAKTSAPVMRPLDQDTVDRVLALDVQ